MKPTYVGPVAQSVQRLPTGWTVRGSNPDWVRFSAPVQTGPEAHPASCTIRTRSFPGVRCGRGVTLTPYPLLVQRSKIEQSIPLLSLRAFVACERVKPTYLKPTYAHLTHTAIEVKGKGHPTTGREGPEGEQRYSSTLSLTSVLDDGWVFSTPRPGRFTPGKDPVPIVQENGWTPGKVWTGAEYLAAHRNFQSGASLAIPIMLSLPLTDPTIVILFIYNQQITQHIYYVILSKNILCVFWLYIVHICCKHMLYTYVV